MCTRLTSNVFSTAFLGELEKGWGRHCDCKIAVIVSNVDL